MSNPIDVVVETVTERIVITRAVQGPPGPQGPAGPSGATGAQGPTGNTGPTGPQGIQGDTGPQGPQGIQGDVGPQGLQGIKGDTGDTGPQGIQGPAGADGAQGPQGIQGPAGPQGLTGDTGPQGPEGPQGIQGIQGIQGPAGADGATGPQGPAGADGATGPAGPAGPTGDTGATGPQGPQGVQGIQGPAGADGATGPTGPTGPAGADGADGATGPQGPAGATGPEGPAGMGFTIAKTYVSVAALEADTAPTGILANQFALIETGNVNDPDNAKLYRWTGSVYVFVTDLSGAAGVTGPQGPEGPQGIQGPAGPQGIQGPAGADGATGPAGPTGPQGPAGSPGASSKLMTATLYWEMSSNISTFDGLQQMDFGVTPNPGELGYLKGQTNTAENGLYQISAGAWTLIASAEALYGSAAMILTRIIPTQARTCQMVVFDANGLVVVSADYLDSRSDITVSKDQTNPVTVGAGTAGINNFRAGSNVLPNMVKGDKITAIGTNVATDFVGPSGGSVYLGSDINGRNADANCLYLGNQAGNDVNLEGGDGNHAYIAAGGQTILTFQAGANFWRTRNDAVFLDHGAGKSIYSTMSSDSCTMKGEDALSTTMICAYDTAFGARSQKVLNLAMRGYISVVDNGSGKARFLTDNTEGCEVGDMCFGNVVTGDGPYGTMFNITAIDPGVYIDSDLTYVDDRSAALINLYDAIGNVTVGNDTLANLIRGCFNTVIGSNAGGTLTDRARGNTLMGPYAGAGLPGNARNFIDICNWAGQGVRFDPNTQKWTFTGGLIAGDFDSAAIAAAAQGMWITDLVTIFATNQSLTGPASGAGTNGVTPNDGQKIYASNQTTPAENGIYTVNDAGAWVPVYTAAQLHAFPFVIYRVTSWPAHMVSLTKFDANGQVVSQLGLATQDNIGILDGANVWTKGNRSAVDTSVTITSNIWEIPDLSQANKYSLTLTNSGTTVTIANPTTGINAGQGGTIFITQDGTTASDIAFGSKWKPVSGTAASASLTLGAKNLLTYEVQDVDTIWYSYSTGGVV